MKGFFLFIRRRIAAIIIILFAVTAGFFAANAKGTAWGRADADSMSGSVSDGMEVHFIDVGQGDSTLIVCGGEAMLIDAGVPEKGTAVQLYLKKHNVSRLKYLVLTHPDSDHIGGAPVIITKFPIDAAYISNYTKSNEIYEKLMQAFEYKNLKPAVPEVGSTCTLGKAAVTFLAPNKKYDNPNDSSIALIIQYGKKRFLFTGDASASAEADIMANGLDISADVYKAGHHGSRYSSSQAFLDEVKPAASVISCGEGNKYGHPHAETLNRFRADDIAVYRTDEEGTVIASTDGKTIRWSVPASTTWKAGESGGTAAVPAVSAANAQSSEGKQYVVNKSSKKFHLPSCPSAGKISRKNREDVTCTRDELIKEGYTPCKICDP